MRCTAGSERTGFYFGPVIATVRECEGLCDKDWDQDCQRGKTFHLMILLTQHG